MGTNDSITFWVNGLAVASWGLLLLLMAVSAVRCLVRAHWDFLAIVAVSLAALLIRVTFADRLPMTGSHGDFTHFRDIGVWLEHGLGKFMGLSYPAGYRLLFWAVFKVTGPSVEGAFWLTTVMGSLTAGAAYVVGAHLTGSRLGGVLAGLALAAYPPAIYFCNGLSLETGASFLLTSSVAAFVALLSGGGVLAAAIWVLSLTLFVQTRGEGLGIAALTVFLELIWAWRVGRLGNLVRYWWVGLLAIVGVAPYVWSMVSLGQQNKVADFIPKLMTMLAQAAAATLLFAAFRGWLRTAVAARWFCTLFLLIVAALYLHQVAVWYAPQQWWMAVAKAGAEHPFLTYYGVRPDMTTAFYYSPGVFPAWWGVLALLALAPLGRGKGLSLSMGVPLVLGVPWLANWLLADLLTGNLIAEGIRYHVPVSGLFACAVGVGAHWLWVQLSGGPNHVGIGTPVRRLGAALLVFAALLAPLWTHAAFLKDVRHNVQTEYLFVRTLVDQAPERTLVVLPDFPVNLNEAYVGGTPKAGDSTVRITDWFRTDQLFSGLGAMQKKQVEIAGLGHDLNSLYFRKQPSLVYLGQDCYRVPPPSATHKWCQWALQLPGTQILFETTVQNRRYTGAGYGEIGPSVPNLTLRLLKVPPEAVRLLLQRISEDPDLVGQAQ